MRQSYKRAGIVMLWLLLIGAVAVLAVFTVVALQRNNALDSRLSSTEEALMGSQSEIASLDDALLSVDQELAATKATVNSQADELRATKGELQGTTDALEATKAQVRTTSTQLATTDEALSIAEETLAVTVTELQAVEDNARETEQRLADTQDRLAATGEELAGANAELASTKQDLASTNSDIQATNRELGDTQQALADTAEALGVATSDITALQTQVAGTSQELTEIKTAIGSVERLREEALGLEVEITELREQRKPLILDTLTRGFVCTGSMEPKIGCTDSALWLRNYDPADIVEGAFVAFSNAPDACWTGNTEGRSTAHRVIDIQERNGERQYRTKGDNSRGDDGCWLSAEHINSYAIEFYEDTHPERQWQRNSVNAAVDAYREVLDEYEAYLGRHCTLNRSTDRYRCREPYFTRATTMLREVERLGELRDCWVDHARNYDWEASSIPVLPPCGVAIALGLDSEG